MKKHLGLILDILFTLVTWTLFIVAVYLIFAFVKWSVS